MDKKGRLPILLIVYLLSLIGIAYLSISSLSEAQSNFEDKFFFIKKQLIWLSGGTLCLWLSSLVKPPLLKKLTLYFYLISCLLLVIVLLPGFSTTIFGAKRWLSLGFFSVQPTEIFKFAAILYFAHLFSSPQKRTIKNLLLTLLPPLFLILLQPNMSSIVLITAIVFSLYYLSGGDLMPLFGVTSFGIVAGILLIIMSPYRSARLQTLLNPDTDSTTSSYHVNQIVIGLSSGGIFGKGFANSTQKYQYLPQLATDSILAVIGEEMGFVGVFTILLLYYSLIINLFKISSQAADPFSQLVVCGIALWIAFQTLINCAAIVALIPLTGIPLPFISYGGSSLLMLLSAIGIVRSIEKSNVVKEEKTDEKRNKRS